MNDRASRRAARERDQIAMGAGSHGKDPLKYTIHGKLRRKFVKKLEEQAAAAAAAGVDGITVASLLMPTTSQAVTAVKHSSKKINYDALKVRIEKVQLLIVILYVYAI